MPLVWTISVLAIFVLQSALSVPSGRRQASERAYRINPRDRAPTNLLPTVPEQGTPDWLLRPPIPEEETQDWGHGVGGYTPANTPETRVMPIPWPPGRDDSSQREVSGFSSRGASRHGQREQENSFRRPHESNGRFRDPEEGYHSDRSVTSAERERSPSRETPMDD